MKTLQDVFDEFKLTPEGQEAMCHFENVLRFQKTWSSLVDTTIILISDKCSEDIISEIEIITQKHMGIWKEQEKLFLETLDDNFDLSLIDNIQGYKNFDKLFWNVDYVYGDILIGYKPVDVSVSFWNDRMKNILMK